jgi:hypothetical protein
MNSIVLPPPPETVRCSKCDRDVVVAVNPGTPGIETECSDSECPIARAPDNQPSGRDGTLICFAERSEISEEGRRARFAQWEKIGVDRIKHDLLNGGHQLVGGPPAVRELAWEWVRMKEAEALAEARSTAVTRSSEEIFTLKPAIWGMGVNLKELWRHTRCWWKKRQ